MQQPIMIFKIHIDNTKVNQLEGPYGGAYFIPFTGEVESELFSGHILPGAADIQTEDLAGTRHMCAKYMFEGTDSEGNTCHLFVENNGWMNEKNRKDPFINAYPLFMTESTVLGPYICQQRFRSEVHPAECGVDIWIFDVLKD